MNNFIFQSNIVVDSLCNDIIDNSKQSTDKNTENIIIDDSEQWKHIKTDLDVYLFQFMEKCIESITPIVIHNIFGDNIFLQTDMILYHKFNENYSNDFSILLKHCNSMFTYIFFLSENTDNNAKIVFWNKYTLYPQKGDIIVFPADWTYPYIMMNSDNRIVEYHFIKGLLYQQY